MIAIIFVAFIALIGAAFAIYLWQRTPSSEDPERVLPAPHSAGLFGRTPTALPEAETQETLASERQDLVGLARAGDLTALDKAHSIGDAMLYSDVLTALTHRASERQEDPAALVSHVSKSDGLRANKHLARWLIEKWKAAPDRRSTTEMIHIAALSDDAETYTQAVDAALQFWRDGRLAQFSADQMAELFVSQYWVIAPEARRGGVAFALKRRLLGIRRELAAAKPSH